jgi:hypothetical protein
MGGEIEVRDAPWAEVGRGFKCAEQGKAGDLGLAPGGIKLPRLGYTIEIWAAQGMT